MSGEGASAGGFSWDPTRYARFAGDRERPAQELFARAAVGLDPGRPVQRVLDLGCGTGGLLLAAGEAFPGARLVGVDLSESMLDRARAELPGDLAPRLELLHADLQGYDPGSGVDLLLSNATLHWLEDRLGLLERWSGALAPGGVLAVQVPLSTDEPSHRAMREVLLGHLADHPATAELLRELEGRRIEPAADWYAVLHGSGLTVDLWETRYLQVLSGTDPVLQWVSGTGLGPVLRALAGEPLERFLLHYRERLCELYAARADGTTLFPFPRRFVVARRPR